MINFFQIELIKLSGGNFCFFFYILFFSNIVQLYMQSSVSEIFLEKTLFLKQIHER